MFHIRIPESEKAIVFLAFGRYDSPTVASGDPQVKKRAGGRSAGWKELDPLSCFYGCPKAFRAKHLGLFALSLPHRDSLEIWTKRALSSPF
jgi:hypothetical protein